VDRAYKWVVLGVFIIGLVILALSVTPPADLGFPPGSSATYLP
jgi:hypothetical protein